MKRSPISRYTPIIVTFLLLIMGTFAIMSCEEIKTKKPRAEQAARGKVHFEKYCSSCHGMDGKGITIDSLEVQPSDLTQIVSSRGGGKFPLVYVVKKIDGRNEVKAHGPRAMPVWGEKFTVEEGMDVTELRGRLGELVTYLMTIQDT
jgi:mono/diheme cytochrome c family protein